MAKKQEQPDDPLLNIEQVMAEACIARTGVYQAVKEGRLPKPLYPLSNAPRWRRSEVRAALEATRLMPSEAKAQRRRRQIEAAKNETTRAA